MTILRRDIEEDIAEAIIDVMDEKNINAEEAIPGLILAIKELAHFTEDQEETLEEAADLLADN